MIIIRTIGFNAVAAEGGSAAVEQVSGPADVGKSVFVGEELAESDRPELTAAKTMVSSGRGIQNDDNSKVFYALVDRLGAAVGASCAAADTGPVPNDMQAGQADKIVAPQLYIAVGISDAIQHLTGMKNSKVTVTINKDEEVPIFQVAGYDPITNLFDIISELEKAVWTRS